MSYASGNSQINCSNAVKEQFDNFRHSIGYSENKAVAYLLERVTRQAVDSREEK